MITSFGEKDNRRKYIESEKISDKKPPIVRYPTQAPKSDGKIEERRRARAEKVEYRFKVFDFAHAKAIKL